MIAQSLRALVANVIDYAGLYPPAALPLADVVRNYERYLEASEAWMLNRLVLPIDKLGELVAGEPGSLPAQVETLETKSGGRLSRPTYCEVPLELVGNGYAKIRTTDPSCERLAEFLCGAVGRRLPFKATAGLHHPIRSASMHGFVNVLVAATFAWSGMDRATVMQVLNETDAAAFEFHEDELRWREWRASTEEVGEAHREFAHSFGSCSFEEPVSDLRALGLLP